MKIAISFYLVLSFCHLFAQTEDNLFNQLKAANDSEINVVKPDSIFWVNDIQKFAEENNLDFFAVRSSGYEAGLDYYVLGEYSRYSFAEALEYVHIAVKEKANYKVILLPNTAIPHLSGTSVVRIFLFGNHKILELEGHYSTAWSMMSPVSGAFYECNKSVIYIDINSGEVLFSKVFKSHYEDTHIYDKYNIDSLNQGLYPDGVLENDTLPAKSTFQWFNYYYTFNNNTIEFYKVDEDPTGECNSLTTEQEKEVIAKYVKDKKPNFWYEYIEKEKKWVKKN